MTGENLGPTAHVALSVRSSARRSDICASRRRTARAWQHGTNPQNAEENYPAWLEAIASARSTIHFETYIIHRDDTGLRFAEALAERARDGVRVRLLY